MSSPASEPPAADSSPIPALPERPDHAHKRSFGECLVVGGSTDAVGAPALIANAALRAGCGSVTVAASAAVLPRVLALAPCAVGLVLIGDPVSQVRAWLKATKRPVIAAGPGLDPIATPPELISMLVQAEAPVVLDATGLRLLARHPAGMDQHRGALVLTPHPGEFRALAEALDLDPAAAVDPELRPAAARALAERCAGTVVLKGAGTIVAEHDRHWQGPEGNAALATAGTGDVLTGLIAAFIGQGLDAYAAARLAVHLHAAAAAHWRRDHGPRGLLASDLPELLPRIMADHASPRADPSSGGRPEGLPEQA
jgi:hydroxyethylthiazole kinase-like uncharacterized protein yjeF